MKTVQNEAKVLANKMELDYVGAMSRIGIKSITLDAGIGEMATGLRTMANQEPQVRTKL